MKVSEARDLFVDERRRLGYKEIGIYERTLDQLLGLVKSRLGREPSVVDVTRNDLTRLLDLLTGRGLSKGTVAHAASALIAFFRWLSRRGALLLNPAENLVVGLPPRRIGYVPSRVEVEELMKAAGPELVVGRAGELDDDERQRVLSQAVRDMAILELLYGSGLRLSEVVKLKVEDVDLAERTAFLKSAKGGKDRVVPLTRRAAEALSRYLVESRPLLLDGLTKHGGVKRSDVLFVTASGTRLYAHDWRERSFDPGVKAAGLPRALTPHRLRHACAVHLLEDGADIAHIGRLLGHERLDTTAIYLSLTTSRVALELERAHPRERSD